MSNYSPVGGFYRRRSQATRAHCPNSAPSQRLWPQQQKNGAEESARWRKSLCIFHIIRCRAGRSPPRALQFSRYEYYYNKCPIQSILIHGQHGCEETSKNGEPCCSKGGAGRAVSQRACALGKKMDRGQWLGRSVQSQSVDIAASRSHFRSHCNDLDDDNDGDRTQGEMHRTSWNSFRARSVVLFFSFCCSFHGDNHILIDWTIIYLYIFYRGDEIYCIVLYCCCSSYAGYIVSGIQKTGN